MSNDSETHSIDVKFMMKAMRDQFARLNTRIEDMESTLKGQTRASGYPMFEEEHKEEDSDYNDIISRRGRRVSNNHDGNLGSIKMKIPSFQGKNNPET